MPRRKTEKADLREKYPIYMEVALVLVLALLVVAFRVDFASNTETDWEAPEQEQIDMEEIQQTQQQETPPPPPKPPVPVEVPNDEALEDEALDLDASLDLDAGPAEAPPPPPDEEEEEEEAEPEIFVVVEDMPELIGGLKSIQEHITYPEMAKKAGVEGRVIVQFIVDEQGNVQNPQVVRGLGAGLDEVAVNAVKQAKFKPGQQRGQPVKVKMSLPVTFRLR